MDRRVLADLERREVEPERPDLPAEVRDLAPGDAVEAIGEQRLLELGELLVQLVGRGVPAGARCRLPGQAPHASGAAARR